MRTDKVKNKPMPPARSELLEALKTVFLALTIAFVLRTFIFQPFHIPSGSMQPNLVKGDYIITTKFSVGYGKFAALPFPFPVKSGRLMERAPKRGDVIVFRPQNVDKNFIKRVVGLPGDEMQMISGRLYINGTATKLVEAGTEIRLDFRDNEDPTNVQIETFSNGHSHRIYNDVENGDSDDTDTYIVPSGHYFMMGDNRDHSADSRVSVTDGGAGYVPAENLIGKAQFVLLSVTDQFSILKPWTWGHINSGRFFKAIK